jgi:A/G-specific adenine glycosylase
MSDFAYAIITWQKQFGRHHLPWQQTRDPYAVWVSEIMLQQTQVTAVIGYYAHFMQRFPTIAALASASQEEVLQYWSGLGYYSRARNLHHAAQKIVDDFSGQGVDVQFPTRFEDILSLPGIGRSTAAAISTFALNQPKPILDGNVKRVFARHFNIAGYTGLPKVSAQLWQIAERENPMDDTQHAIAYTQGLMDLGATLCTRTKPRCPACPVNTSCQAYAQNTVNQLPTPKPKKISPQKETTMLIVLDGGEVLLEKRPQKGIWAGLWSLPEISMSEIASEVAQNRFGYMVEAQEPLPIVHHAFTHFKLAITPQPLLVIHRPKHALPSGFVSMSITDAIGAAIPTPVRQILLHLR